MNREELIKIFEDTKIVSKTLKNNSVSNKHTFVSKNILPIGDKIINIQVLNLDTVSAAQKYSLLGKTCVLNMASAKKAGGGVINGAKAQEECLFRSSNLFETVTQDMYPIGHNEAIYTNDVIFFRDKEYNLILPFTVDVVTIPAVNLNSNAKYDDLDIISDYDEIMKNKIRLMFDLAASNGCENLILGAWGCGVFKNNPLDVAKFFEEVLFEKPTSIAPCFAETFKNVIFAIINDHNSVGDNYDVFFKYFG